VAALTVVFGGYWASQTEEVREKEGKQVARTQALLLG
jgi:hypothetical protein